ncbi:unnamed protein product [Closterium sp. NIES-65]|nr:unnamed protein product [Closterium sp. NIES-65]
MDSSCRGASLCLLVSLLLLSLSVLRIHARYGPEVGASGGRQNDPSAGSGGGGAANTGSDVTESIAEWRRRSAEAGAHFFPLQRAEVAPSRDELHRRILGPSGVGGGLKNKGTSPKSSQKKGFPLPLLDYDSTLLSTANGTLGNTLVNYSTYLDDNQIRLPVYPYYVTLKLGSQKQQFSMALNLASPFTFVPCDCLHCGTSRMGTTTSKPFSTLTSTTLEYISCADQRCQGGSKDGSGYYGCNTDGLSNYLNVTGYLPGDDALCVFDAYAEPYDYYEADFESGWYSESVGHVVQDTVYLTAPDGTEANRSMILGCGVNQTGQWGMQGWQYGSWAAGGVLGLGWDSPFLEQLTSSTSAFAVCLEQPILTNKTGWDGKVPLQTGSSHLTIGATGLPAGASYASLLYPTGMQYSHITLTTAKRALNITDDPSNVDGDSSFLPPGAAEDTTPGFFFMPESFVHLLRYPLFLSLFYALQDLTGQTFDINVNNNHIFRLLCFANKNKAVDPFTAFPTIDIAFLSPDNTISHFYLKPREYLAQVSASEYCVLVTYMLSQAKYASYIGEPGLFNKYLFLDYTNGTAGWIDAPNCGAEPLLPPPSPPPPSPPSPVSKRATRPLSPVAAALTAALALATSATLLALTLL